MVILFRGIYFFAFLFFFPQPTVFLVILIFFASEGGKEKPNIFLDVFAPVESRGIPFAVIFGNHDSGIKKEEEEKRREEKKRKGEEE